MDKLKAWLKDSQVRGFFISVVALAAISLAFFYPDAIDGASLQQSDIKQGIANGQEGAAYEQATGEKALWTNSLFSGMPTIQISPSYPSNSLFRWIDTVYGLWLPSPCNLLFMMMFGFLILLFVMKMRWYYALLGAIAWGFSSYFIIIIGAGHIWKFIALSYIPPTIAGLMLVYRGRYVGGAAMLALFAMMQLNANHPQMSYYFFFVMAALVIAWLVTAIKEKGLRQWGIATAVTIGAGCLAVGANLPSIYNTYEYAKETKRAQSELTPLPNQDSEANDKASRPTGGMPYDQIVGWSYGTSETFSLLVPNIKGGASARPENGQMTFLGLDQLSEAAQFAGTPQGSMLPYLSQYFNDSEGTNGPVYVGALIFVLFVVGCLIVRGPVKWALLIITVLSILLALGRNFSSLTDLMIYNFPMYSKFRAVESILVIAEFTMPLLAVMALHTLLTTPDALRRFRAPLCWSFGLSALVCLIALISPSVFGQAITGSDHAVAQNISQQVMAMAQQHGMSQAQADATIFQYSLSNPANVAAIETLRYGMVKADAMRSLLFIVLGMIVIVLACRGTLKPAVATVAVAALVLIDLYGVDKRYVSHSSFAPAQSGVTAMIPADDIDRAILADTSAHYRVLDIPGFELPNRSYYHKMIGGYHAAKLNRYEDLIQRRLRPVLALGYYDELRNDSIASLYAAPVRDAASNYRILDMLNTRYIITGNQEYPIDYNVHALGNAWLVNKVNYVDGADAEMAALGNIDIASEAVADSRFRDILGDQAVSLAPGDSIWLTSYTPNRLSYHVDTKDGGIGVFSEVYFPWGWHATIDGAPADIARVNYLLRAIALPAGSHEVVMTFDPQSIHICSAIAYACVTLIYLLCFGGLFIAIRKCGLI
ncbi:MAG: YfhO family protein [Muribaculaceae bacterium]|nr:YfhO family protein [Muribaculaceae bacterium]